MAEKRTELLEVVDHRVGVSTRVEEAFGRGRRDLSSARDLQGLTVEHAMDSLREGQTAILTPKDKGALREEEDVLVGGREPAGDGAGGEKRGAAGEKARLPALCRG